MGHITCLPEAVVSRLRSSTVLSDIPQIVEELVCNSLDAEPTQISVHVFPEDHHVIVEDNGCGISENDFALIGERHATSKIQSLGDLEGGIKTLGFRGEALSSLADVAHVTVTSRAQGCRKAFRKTFKGRKPSFEPSSEPKGSGTRVVAREIFGNQPVRRRLFGTSLASQKKVLQGVKERVVRLALMHPRVAILVKDKARQVVFQSRPVECLENAIVDIFGSELFAGLKELDFAKGNLRLTGFLSKLSHGLSSKTAQLLYINRRFVQKTPIHKLLDSFMCNPSEPDLRGSCRKTNSFRAFVLNLTCPLNYDITFEASKTLVEFEDWDPVLSFVQEVLKTLWAESGQFDEDKSRQPRQDFHPEFKVEAESLQVSPRAVPSSKMPFKDPSCEGRLCHQYGVADDIERADFQEALQVKEVPPISPTKRSKVVETPQFSLRATDTVKMLEGFSTFTSNFGKVKADEVEAAELSSEPHPVSRKRKRTCTRELPGKQVNQTFTPLRAEPWLESPGRSLPQASGACILPEDLELSPSSPGLNFESPGLLHVSPARRTGNRGRSLRNVCEGVESGWQLKRCNQDLVVSSPWWSAASRSPHPRSESDFVKFHLSPSEAGISPDASFQPHKYASFPTPECLAITTDPLRVRSAACAEASLRFEEEQQESSQDTFPELRPEATNCSLMLLDFKAPARINGGKVEEDSEVAISKYRRKRWSASSGVEFEGTPRQDSVAEIYKAWISESTKVEGRKILDIATSEDHNFVPEAMTKEKLQHARVLQQVDKKFIAAVAKGYLLLVDQHAADERVRLEQLRREVLKSTTPRVVAPLDQPEELTLTPMDQHVLETYSEQIEHWGWRFKIESTLHRAGGGRAFKVLLNAVPSILQTQLTSQDLTDYLNQLRETQGSSAAPPAVTRILNYKSCRGAIMFGDALLPSECHQLVAHLKQTSLCFQCAHGRPTMVPLVDLSAVHRYYSPVAGHNRFGGAKSVDVRECEVQTPDGKKMFRTFRSRSGRPPKGSTHIWHGLERWLPATLERARVRLRNAERM